MPKSSISSRHHAALGRICYLIVHHIEDVLGMVRFVDQVQAPKGFA